MMKLSIVEACENLDIKTPATHKFKCKGDLALFKTPAPTF
jgi:hypothetical protein